MTCRLLVSVGSDAHPFERLVTGVDSWLAGTRHTVEATVQYGSTAPPAHHQAWDKAVAYLPHDELQFLLRTADVVVTQGGPMGIVEARRQGTIPIVMPRLHELGEHVDNHQLTFCRFLAEGGDILLVESLDQLHQALDAAAAAPLSVRIDVDDARARVEESVARFGELVADLRPRWAWWTQRRARADT